MGAKLMDNVITIEDFYVESQWNQPKDELSPKVDVVKG